MIYLTKGYQAGIDTAKSRFDAHEEPVKHKNDVQGNNLLGEVRTPMHYLVTRFMVHEVPPY